MSDKPKTIQEALAEVRAKQIEKLNEYETAKGTSDILKGVANADIGQVWSGLKHYGSAALTAGKMAKNAVYGAGEWADPDKNKPTTASGGNQTTTVPPSPAASGGSPKPATGTGSTGAAAPTPKTSTSTAVEKTPAAKPSSMSFSQAYAKARELAKAAGKDPNLAQFKWGKEGGPEKTFQAAETKKDYVAMPKQFKVDIGAKEPAGPPMSDYQKPQKGPEGPPRLPRQGEPEGPRLSSAPTPPSPTAPTPETAAKAGLPPKKPNFSVTTNEEKKKMTEEMNPLIAAFLKLQETKAGNVFEAAKKLTKKQDEKLDVVDDDKIDAKDLAALRAGKKAKMDEEQIDELKKPTPETALKVVNRATDRDEWTPKAANRLYDRYKKGYEPKEKKADVKEGSMMDPKDPSVQGGGDVTSSPVKSAKPAAPKKVDGDPSYQGSGEVTKGGKPTSVREAESFLQRFNPFNQVGKAIETKPAESKPDMRIMVNSPPKKQTPKDGSANSAFPANEEVEQVDEISKGKAIATYRDRKSQSDAEYNDGWGSEGQLDHDDYGERSGDKADKTLSRIKNKFGSKIAAHAERSADIDSNGRPNRQGGSDYLAAKQSVYSKFSKPDSKKGTGQRKHYMSINKGRFAEEIDFSETELAFFSSVMEAEPVSKTPVDASDKSSDKSASKGQINITDERKVK